MKLHHWKQNRNLNNFNNGYELNRITSQIERAEIQKSRLIILQEVLEKIQLNKNKKEIGKSVEVLIENKLNKQNKFFGRTEDFTPVIITNGVKSDVGKVMSVDVKECNQNSLFGEKNSSESGVAA